MSRVEDRSTGRFDFRFRRKSAAEFLTDKGDEYFHCMGDVGRIGANGEQLPAENAGHAPIRQDELQLSGSDAVPGDAEATRVEPRFRFRSISN